MPPFALFLREPRLVLFGLTARSQQRTVGLKQVQDLAPRDRHSQRRQSREQFLVHLIDRLVFSQVQPPHQQDDIPSKREVGQCQRIGHWAAVGPLVSWTLPIRAAIARMVQLDYSI